MGKRIRLQRRGKGSPTYRAPSHKYKGEVKHAREKVGEEGKALVGKVVDLLHDPGRSAPVARVRFKNGEERLILAPEGILIGEEIECGISAEIKRGNTLPLAEIPEGTPIHNVEISPKDGGKIARSSGTYCLLISHDVDTSVIQLPSGEMKPLDPRCRATIGVIAGGGRKDKPLVKAGKMYHKTKSKAKQWPKVRGVAMNAVNHPHGGGSSIGKASSVSRHAPPGRKVGLISPRRSGKR